MTSTATSEPEEKPRTRGGLATLPLLMYGVLSILGGVFLYLVGTVLSVGRFIVPFRAPLEAAIRACVWYSCAPILLGLVLAAIDLFVLLPGKRRASMISGDLGIPESARITVVLTAYNDEESIGAAVADFRAQPQVNRVIVVDNNSRDRTVEQALRAGAQVVIEGHPGYGRCVYRCFTEALKYSPDLILLCEGDLTFRASDIPKFLAYLPHADIVNGTRIVEQLRDPSTQLTTFMFYGNFFVGKLLECKHIGKGTLTDVGTTYKLLRPEVLQRLIPHLDPAVNLEFNAHFLDRALARRERLVECPITFHSRVGVSKGGNVNNRRALLVGLRMIAGIIFGWEWVSGGEPKPSVPD